MTEQLNAVNAARELTPIALPDLPPQTRVIWDLPLRWVDSVRMRRQGMVLTTRLRVVGPPCRGLIMASKVRTAAILLGVVAVLDAVFVVAGRVGSTHPPVVVTVLTAVAAVITAAGALGLNRGDSWGWPAAAAGAVLSAVLSVGAIINAPGAGKVAAVLILVLSLVSLVVLLPLRRADRAGHA